MSANTARRLGIFAFFESVREPRVERTRLHPLVNVLIMAMLAMICVGEGWECVRRPIVNTDSAAS